MRRCMSQHEQARHKSLTKRVRVCVRKHTELVCYRCSQSNTQHIHTGLCAQYATKISGTYLSSRFFNSLYWYITVCTFCDKLNIQIQVLGLPVTKKVRCLNSKVDWDPEAEVYILSSFCSALSFFCKSTGTPFSRTNDNSHLCNTRTVMDTHL